MNLSNDLSPEAQALIPILKELIDKNVLRVQLSDKPHEYFTCSQGWLIGHHIDVHLLLTPNDTRRYNKDIDIHGIKPI